jgi:ribonuclease E
MHVSDNQDNSLTGGEQDGHGEGERREAGQDFSHVDGEAHDGAFGDAGALHEGGEPLDADSADGEAMPLPPDLEPVLGGIDEPREAFDPDEARGITLEGVREPLPADPSFDPDALPEREPQPELEVEAWADEDMSMAAAPSAAADGEEGAAVTSDTHEAGEAEAEDEEEEEEEEGGADAESRGARKVARGRRSRGATIDPATRGAKPTVRRKLVMLVNDVPGEECRIAIVDERGRLETYFAERETTATNVGNIYKARVANVEPAIQAAFVDFGTGNNGFLHVSDLHPKYFPGKERTERVGRKIPRRERPAIQEALRRGQEIVVQVIKEGIGTKGPTVSSYLSVPGRLLVMMPDMDRVGVSRKLDDEDQRREMRAILDSLELPEGCGFILRTAGFDATKSELQRDAAYLSRLWTAMRRRSERTGGPCALYTESDLMVRTLRDYADSSIDAIIVDSPGAFERAKLFLEIVAPRAATKVHYWDRAVPLFYAYDVERQIEEIHARQVPLKSGGALVFDQAEALVAIDVNSGRSRSAKDSETNAYQTNCEAVEEIARQLRLRDLGGLIILDLIDMRSPKHRRDIEQRMADALRRDRAKTTFLPIGDFGMMEMTRQRMRPSLRKTHFSDCTHCGGSGEIRMPDAVAADMIRRATLLFTFDRVRRVEIVCSTKVATEMLSGKRRLLHELEERSGKRIDVRISEAFAPDRVDLYAYDERNADIDISRMPTFEPPAPSRLPAELPPEAELELSPEDIAVRKRRRRRKAQPADATAIALSGGFDDLPDIDASERPLREELAAASERRAERAARDRDREESDDDEDRGSRRGRKRRRGQRDAAEERAAEAPSNRDDAAADAGDRSGKRKRRRRGRGRRLPSDIAAMAAEQSAYETSVVAAAIGMSAEALIDDLRLAVDPELAALLLPGTLMLPPELIAIAAQRHPPQDTDEDSSDGAPAAGDASDGSASDSASAGPGDSAGDGSDAAPDGSGDETGEKRGRKKTRRGGRDRGGRDRRSRRTSRSDDAPEGGATKAAAGTDAEAGAEASAPPSHEEREERRHSSPQDTADTASAEPAAAAPAEAPAAAEPAPAPKPRRRSLYSAVLRKLSPAERSKVKGRPE